MDIIDDYRILDSFNQACQALADQLQADPTSKPFGMELGVNIPDIDEWWQIMVGADNVQKRCIDGLLKIPEADRKDYFERGYQSLVEDFPQYKEHFAAITDRMSSPEAANIHYLPHIVDYMDDVFNTLSGFKALKSILAENHLEPVVLLAPREVKEGASTLDSGILHGPSKYDFILITQPFQPVSKPRMH